MPALDFRACSCQWLKEQKIFASLSMLLLLGGLYIVTSASMIAFNKYLIHEGRFPFAVPLVLIHSGFSSLCAFLILLAKPSLFPSLTNPAERVPIDKDLMLRGAFPIACLFSVQLVLANTAYLHSSMAFLQMMKESNLVLVYAFSLIAALEVFSWVKTKMVVLIVFATMLTIHGELNFSWTGFCIQGTSQLFESSKIVLQAMLLTSAGRKLDVLTYVLLVMPLCFCGLAFVLFTLTYVHPLQNLQIPDWATIWAWWPVLAANASLAFVLNLSIALFMKQSSAVGFILAGITKDAVIVLAGALVMHESISKVQMFGFAAQLSFIWIWSLVKIYPDKFEGGILAGIWSLSVPTKDDKCLLTAEPLEIRGCSRKNYGTEDQEENVNQC